MINLDNMFPALIGDHVTVKVPDRLPKLMMDVAIEVIRNQDAGEQDSYSSVADYLENLLVKRVGKEDVIDNMVTLLNKTDAERYIEGMMESGYNIEDLNKLACTIQRGWKYYKIRTLSTENVRSEASVEHETVFVQRDSDESIELAKSYNRSLEAVNEAASIIQRAWKDSNKSVSDEVQSTSNTNLLSKQSKTELVDEIDYEDDSDDLERVNVVKKGQSFYVPPIPDFIDDDLQSFDSYNNTMTNVIDKFQISSFEEE